MAPTAPPRVPSEVMAILDRLAAAGHAAYLVGGGVRDALLGRGETDWDVATDARPERILELFPAARYENRFGTVSVGAAEVTTFRRDHLYADHRRPDSVTFTDDLAEDLARRDFTVNAIAWGRPAGGSAAGWADPTGGLADLAARRLRAIGDPARRFDEDALRLLRAARLAAQLDFEIEPRTLSAMRTGGPLAAHLSGERIGMELRKMLAAKPPSRGFAILAQTAVLEHVLPELAAQLGVPQTKASGGDLWQHCLATLDGAASVEPGNQRLLLAALLHDIGKPSTAADGRFIGHDTEGALLAEALLIRLGLPRRLADEVATLVRQHMFSYESRWSDAAVRRFVRRIGRELVDDLLRLRQADNIGSGLPADAGNLDELRQRVADQLAAGVPLSLAELAIDGNVLIGELGIEPGPRVGWLLERLLEQVVADPARNTPGRLLADARALLGAQAAG
ncbi:MAG TPA: HD domain-containing protein [Candidatus Limnocylindria bacterium]|nr:HD domain-containing protein [Candidatus Limnocylindria bacterium]